MTASKQDTSLNPLCLSSFRIDWVHLMNELGSLNVSSDADSARRAGAGVRRGSWRCLRDNVYGFFDFANFQDDVELLGSLACSSRACWNGRNPGVRTSIE